VIAGPTERNPARVVAFSDAVIAIAITLLVLEIRPPEDTRHLIAGLAALWPSYVSYVITFLLIGQVWANHHVLFDQIRHADRLVLFLNTLLLMDIAFLPFAAAVLDVVPDGGNERDLRLHVTGELPFDGTKVFADRLEQLREGGDGWFLRGGIQVVRSDHIEAGVSTSRAA